MSSVLSAVTARPRLSPGAFVLLRGLLLLCPAHS
jgi:hypothetical protein